MESTFKFWELNRNLYLEFFNRYSLQQLNTIPPGFSNNLIWNIGHIIVVQQLLIYRASQLQLSIPTELTKSYKPGTIPTQITTYEEVNQLKYLLTSVIEPTKQDYQQGKFTTFHPFTTITGFHITSLQEAIEFNNYHEALHLGYMTNIKKFV